MFVPDNGLGWNPLESLTAEDIERYWNIYAAVDPESARLAEQKLAELAWRRMQQRAGTYIQDTVSTYGTPVILIGGFVILYLLLKR